MRSTFGKCVSGARVVFCASKGENPRRRRRLGNAPGHHNGALCVEKGEASLTSTFCTREFAPEWRSARRKVGTLVRVDVWKTPLGTPVEHQNSKREKRFEHRRVEIFEEADVWKMRLGARVAFCAPTGGNPRIRRHLEITFGHRNGALCVERCESSFKSMFGKCAWAPKVVPCAAKGAFPR